jgi:hypothetical protein
MHFQLLPLFSALDVHLNVALKNMTTRMASLHSDMRQVSHKEEVKGIQTKDTQSQNANLPGVQPLLDVYRRLSLLRLGVYSKPT